MWWKAMRSTQQYTKDDKINGKSTEMQFRVTQAAADHIFQLILPLKSMLTDKHSKTYLKSLFLLATI